MRLTTLLLGRVKSALVSLLLLPGCSADHDLELPHTIDVGTFTVNVPEGWKLIKDVGYDSYVGRIVGPLGTIRYDQGFFSFGGLDMISENDHTIYFERSLINDLPVIIHKERAFILGHKNRDVLLTAYLEGENGMRNRLYVYNPSPLAEKIFLEIIMTHKFK